MRPLRHRSIRTKLLLAILGVSLSGIAALAMLAVYQEQHAARAALAEEIRSLARLVASRSEAALAFDDTALAQENANALSDLPQIDAACIYDGRAALFAAWRRAGAAWSCPESVGRHTEFADASDNGLLMTQPIGPAETPLGQVLIRASTLPLERRLDAQLAAQAWTAVGIAVLSLLLALWLQRLISAPITEVRDVALKVVDSGDYSIRAPVRSEDEVGELSEHFNRMLAKIDAQNRDLVELNASLEDAVEKRTADLRTALDTLQRAQDELVRSEKMAALGSLVAGVAHELNTPIGNALTVASTLEHHSDELRALNAANQMRRSQLDAYLKLLADAGALIRRNLDKAHELVGSFKRVAVDQTSDKRRVFDLAEVVEETLITLRPGLKATRYSVSNAVPPGIRMDSFPGAVGQIISNLVNNAVLHGFDNREQGQMWIDAQALDGQRVQLRFRDDGVGMNEDTQRRAFDPFFTTRLGHGGSGLGLSLVFNMTTAMLGGRVALHSEPGNGTEFLFEWPLQAPERAPVGLDKVAAMAVSGATLCVSEPGPRDER